MKRNKNSILAIDFGGNAIKYGIVINHQIVFHSSFLTPKTVIKFFKEIKKIHQKLFLKFNFKKVVISSPGTFNFSKKRIESISAITWIHKKNFY